MAQKNTIQLLINELQSSNLYAECQCGEEFKLSNAIMFDGAGEFPKAADDKRKLLLLELEQRKTLLMQKKVNADEGAEKKSIEVGMGKCLERIMPACKGFCTPISDCRPVYDPIDMVLFNGLSHGKVESITFMEIKTGAASLNRHQRLIKDAIINKKVSFRWY